MEAVGARLGRSSTRYGPATVFTGPVRRWKRKWVQVAPPPPPPSSTTAHHSHQINGHANGTSNGNNGSHLLLYKWTPITQSQNGAVTNHTVANGDKDRDDPLAGNDEPPRRKFKYIPIAVLEEQQNEAAQQVEAEAIDSEPAETEANAKNEVLDEKPDINDTPMEENEENNQVVCQDLNETLDLSLGMNGNESEAGSALETE